MTCFIHRLSISAEKPIGHRNNFAIDQLPCFDLLAPTAIPNLHLGKRFLPTFLLSFPPPSIDRRTILLTGHSPCTQKLILSSVALPVSDPNKNALPFRGRALKKRFGSLYSCEAKYFIN